MYITKHRPQETVKAQPVQSTEALVAAVAAPAPDSESGPCCACDNEGVVDDCCCAFWCGCCATAQIARHEYAIPATGTVKYDCCSATGEP